MIPRSYGWIAAAIVFAGATVWINYEIKVNIQLGTKDGATREMGHLEVGQSAPDFSARDLADRTVRLSDYRGQKVVLLDFWATWCGPCKLAMPGLQSIQDDFKGRGLEILSLNEGESAEQAGGFIKKKGYGFHVLLDAGSGIGASYGVRGIPTMVVVDKQGVVRWIFSGARVQTGAVNIIFLIAADSIRALLRQRLLLGLMLVALACIAVFSTFVISERKMMTRAAVDRSLANEVTDERETKKPDAAATPATPGGSKLHRADAKLSKVDRQKLAEQLDQVSSFLQALFYQAASFGGSLVSLFIFSTAVASEIRRGTIRITLTKPVSRIQYILGKFLGGIAVMAGYACLASVALILVAKFGELQLSPAMKYAPWLMFCRQLMLGSLAMLLSLFVHPFIGAVLAFFAGNGLYGRFNPLFYVLPSYGVFNLSGQMLEGTLMSGTDVLLLSLYALDFVVLMLLLALWRFRRKELV